MVQFPPMVISCITMVKYQDQEMLIGTVYRCYSDISSYITTHCVCSFIQFCNIYICVTAATIKIQTVLARGSPLPDPELLATINLLCISIILLFLRTLYKWNHTICKLLRVAFFQLRLFQDTACFNSSFFFIAALWSMV